MVVKNVWYVTELVVDTATEGFIILVQVVLGCFIVPIVEVKATSFQSQHLMALAMLILCRPMVLLLQETQLVG